jgi:integrase
VTKHLLLDGKLHLYQRKGSPYWQCAAYLGRKNWRVTTKEEDFARAKDVAEDWYQTLTRNLAAGRTKPLRKFHEVAAVFFEEYKIITAGERSPRYVKSHEDKIRLYLNPFFGEMPVDEITSGTVMDFRVWRQKLANEKYGKPAARQTLKQNIVTLRLILSLAARKGWIDYLPNLSEPYRPSWKVSHRAWFSAAEYYRLCKATWAYVQSPPAGVRVALCQHLHDYVVFMANTGLRTDEAANLEFRDIVIDEEEADDPILVIDVRGKTGVGYCKSMPTAVRAFRRILKRAELAGSGKPEPTDKVFFLNHRDLFNRILMELDLKTDREGRPRTAYSLRHTYICLRLLNGANIYQIAKNCRTSVLMIEKYYAAHIATSIDTARLNVGRGLGDDDDDDNNNDVPHDVAAF